MIYALKDVYTITTPSECSSHFPLIMPITGLAVPNKSAAGEVNMNTCVLHELCGFKIPAENIVDFSCSFIRITFFVNVDGQSIVFLFLTLQRKPHKWRVAHNVILFPLRDNAFPIKPQSISLNDVSVCSQWKEI